MNKEIKNNIIEANGDIFKIFISMYDCMENNFAKEEDIKLYKKIYVGSKLNLYKGSLRWEIIDNSITNVKKDEVIPMV